MCLAIFHSKDNANERNESWLSNCRVQLIFFICILLDKVRFSITKPFVNYIVGKWKLK